jgi:hypothetical protein
MAVGSWPTVALSRAGHEAVALRESRHSRTRPAHPPDGRLPRLAQGLSEVRFGSDEEFPVTQTIARYFTPDYTQLTDGVAADMVDIAGNWTIDSAYIDA